ncbi:amino acid adenylation domain-containing protein [Paenibacillus kribbensis]|uniref:non-ribosomal peptide synthetase n=4 Tax=Paenibacillus TaxID=44249 RepID=UPI002DB781DE|nr:non-ribosomal peptide synthetase [Paenibacillus kribbensis]MEC0235535.1 amino acid adenylation domain-containing protein [Paenibacillus kribbensis]
MTKPKIQKVYPLTPMQEGMLFHAMLDPESSSYFTQMELHITGNLDTEVLQQSVDELVRSNDILRTVFVYQQLQRPRQIVLAERKAEVHCESLEGMQPASQQHRMESYKREIQAKGFDLAKDMLFRVAVFRLSEHDYRLVWSNHHILIDGWSLGVLMKKLFGNYEKLRSGSPLPPEREKPYGDYIKWLEMQDKAAAYAFWDGRLEEFGRPTPLPWRKTEADGEAYRNEEFKWEWEPELVTALKAMANQYQVTAPNLFQALWGALLARYNDSEDAVFGTVVSGRPASIRGVEQMAGLFINTVPVRVTVRPGTTFADLFTTVQSYALEAEQHDYLPLYEIQKRSELQSGLVSHLLAFENYPLDRELANGSLEERLGFSVRVADSFEQTNYNFNLIVYPGETWSLKMMYNAAVFERDCMEKAARHLTALLRAALSNPDSEVNRACILNEAEQDEIARFHGIRSDYPRDKSIAALFEEQTERTPDREAVIWEGGTLTYRELNARANRIARRLRARGVQSDEIVGLMTEKSADTVIGVLAILKAGGAYLPMDPEYPEERISYLLEDSGARLTLTQRGLADRLNRLVGADVLIIDEEEEVFGAGGEPPFSVRGEEERNLAGVNGPDDLAYVIYTSGSTGRPKGVMVEQRNVIRLVKDAGYIPFGEEERMAQTGAISFDASTFELFGALLHGAGLYLVPKDTLLDGDAFAGFLRKHGITMMWLTSPLFNNLSQHNPLMFASVRHLIIGGDTLAPAHVNRVRKACPNLSLWNGYGPTENTTFSTCFRIDRDYDGSVPIGRPIGSSTAYIVNTGGQQQPIGIPGELCVGGDGVARGYLNCPELTTDKFVEDPFTPGGRMYRTGDLARWLPDGNIEYLGRMDNQVKIRGFRIELGEIEARLMQVEGIREAVVVVNTDQPGENTLSAYVIGEQPITAGELRTALSRMVPDYMLPSHFIQLQQMPLTPNGKVDRKKLPEPGVGEAVEGYVAPANEMEQLLADLWSEALDVEKVGAEDNFFTLGGHSLKAMMLTAKIRQQLHKEVTIKTLFERPTVRELAACLQTEEADGGSELQDWQPINPAPAAECFPVSSVQRRMYIVNQLGETGISYNIPAVLLLEGEADVERLETAFRQLIERHESLRTSFEMAEGALVQRIHRQVPFSLEILTAKGEEAEALIRQFIRPFDLHKAPLVRAALVALEAKRHLLMIDMHHIISDGSSTGILVNDLARLYHGESLPAPQLHYKDFAVWQNEEAQRESMKRLEAYWLDTFKGELPVLDLPTDYPRPHERNYAGDRVVFGIDGELAKQVRGLAAETDTTVYMVLLAAFSFLLAQYSSQEDIIVGSPTAGRTRAETAGIPGMFINTLALRCAPSGTKTFRNYLNEIKETTLQAFAHQDYPLEELIEKLPLERDISRNPLFSVSFNMLNMEIPPLRLDGLMVSPYAIHHPTSKFDLTLEAVEQDGPIGLSFDYAAALFTQETIRRWSGHLLQILRHAVSTPDSMLNDVELLPPTEMRYLLEGSSPDPAYEPPQGTFYGMLNQRARLTPDRTAILCGAEKWSYRELEDKAARLAGSLRAHGVGRDSVVGLLLGRSAAMIVAMLAVMKAGGAYLPIDPETPDQRIGFMLEDSRALLLIADGDNAERLPEGYRGAMLNVDDDSLYESEPWRSEGDQHESESLAYIIYTSGTTGNPKGVQLTHRGLLHYARWFAAEAKLSPDDKTMLLSSYAFDLGYTSLYPVLLAGGELHIVSKETVTSPDRLSRYIGEQEITYIKCTPSLFHTLVPAQNFAVTEHLASLRLAVLGGEPINPADLRRFHGRYPRTRLMNHYGPTETTVGAVAQFIDTERLEEYVSRPTIGRPIRGAGAFILNPGRRLVAPGVIGELYLAGPGLARGYLNRPDLTAEKFVTNPYDPEKMLFRTGDLARMLPDGRIEFMGRRDDQVKIRGYRVEPKEIEAVLLQHEAVREAAVVTTAAEGGMLELSAYFVAASGLAVAELRSFLAVQLPGHMIPSYFIPIDALPLTANGKLDRRALPEPRVAVSTAGVYAAPETDIEAKLCAVWAETLGVERVGIEDNFFNLGGHSLKAILLVGAIQSRLGRDISLKALFEHPTVRALARYMEETAVWTNDGKAATDSVMTTAEDRIRNEMAPAAKRDYYPVSSAQKRMYILHKLDPQSTGYNMPAVLLLEGALDVGRLDGALHSLVARHESLRTSFTELDGTPVQMIHPAAKVPLHIVPAGIKETEALIADFVRPFDLSSAPLLRTGLIRLSDNRHLLLLDMHHIVADGVTRSLFVREIARLYKGEVLPAPKLHYKDFAVWQEKTPQREHIALQERYWLDRFAEPLPNLELPADFPRPPVQSFRGGQVRFQTKPETAEHIRYLMQETGTTLHMVMLAAFGTFLAKMSGQEDIAIGTAVAGRSIPAVQEMPGMFVNTLALRCAPENGKTFREFLLEVKETCLEALDHQDYPFEELVGKLDLPRDLSRNPLVSVMLTVDNPDRETLRLDGLAISPYGNSYGMAKFDLTLGAFEDGDSIGLQFEYAADLFGEETVGYWSGYLLNLLSAAASEPDIQLGTLPLLTEQEQHVLLEEWNQTGMEVPEDRTVVGLFEEQAERTPEAAAVTYGGKTWSYRELNGRANQLARLLRERGAGSERAVGIMVKPSLEMASGVLGIMKAGAAYVPIDPDYPAQRIAYILADSGALALVTQSGLPIPEDYSGEVVYLDGGLSGSSLSGDSLHEGVRFGDVQMGDSLGDGSRYEADLPKDSLSVVSAGWTNEPNPPLAAGPHDLAYMIYTSGTTGQPKGVMVEHQSLVNLCCWHNEAFGVTAEDRSAKYAGFGFDASVWELFPYWVAGAEIHVIDESIRMDLEALNRYFETNSITITFLPTQLCEQFMELENRSLRVLLTGGDKLKRALPPGRSYRLVNNYGPTESTVVATSMTVEAGEAVPAIGKPIANMRVYVLGAGDMPQPIGVPGELCIAGRSLARGYRNRPEETTARFVADPFVPGGVMYRTGDLVKWRSDGRIEYVGRIDQQVKVRGFRIELAEIESRLLSHPEVKEAAVLDVTDKQGQTALCAYVVAPGLTEGAALDVERLKRHLAAVLPDYMVPAYWTALAGLPVTANGKLDRRALPQPDTSAGASAYREPASASEALLAEVWQDVLGVERVGTEDNFFALGGDSIKAIQMASRLHKHGWKLEMKDLFRNPTIVQVSPYLEELKGERADQSEVKGEVKLTPVQRWFFEQRFTDRHHWNQSVMLYAEKGFERSRTEAALRALVEHHDALRMVYGETADGVVQYNRGVEGELFTLKEFDYRTGAEGCEVTGPETWKRAIESEAERIQSGIDLSHGPLVKAAMFHTDQGSHLLIVIHHLVVDGVSWRILLEDFAAGYVQAGRNEPITLQDKTNSFRQWAAELEKYAHSEAFLKQAGYWQELKAVDIAALPKDSEIGIRQVKDHAAIQFGLTEEETQHLLTRAHRSYGTEINDLLLSALVLTFREWTGQEKVSINLEGHGREEILQGLDISRTVGWFTAQYPVVLDTGFADDPSRLIPFIKESLRTVPDKGIGYGIYRYLYLFNADESDMPSLRVQQPEISFNYLGQIDSELNTDFFEPSPYEMGSQTSPDSEALYALNFVGIVRNGCFTLSCSFNKREFLRGTVAELMERFRHHLCSLIRHCVEKEDRDYTPSDFSAKGLEMEDVSDIFEMLGEKFN